MIEEYWACDSLELWFRQFYASCGLNGASSHSGRRTFATRLLESGVDIEDVSRLLGHGDLDFARPDLEFSKDAIRYAFAIAL